MTDPEMLPWLRDAITARLELAREAADGDSGEWFMGRKWNVYRAEDEARYDDDYQGEENRLVTWGNVKPQSLHIAANDPRDTIARCEAELAILDEHRLILADRGYHDHADHRLPQQYRVVNDNPDAQAIGRANMMQYDLDCHACHRRWPCRTVSLLAAGYRHHPGWKAEWAA